MAEAIQSCSAGMPLSSYTPPLARSETDTRPMTSSTSLLVCRLIVFQFVFRWRRLWPRIAEHLGVRPEGFAGEPRPLEEQMAGQEDAWAAVARREGLVEPDLSRVASWWHTDADLGRPFEVFADMGRSRDLGFTGHRRTEESFLRALDRYREARILPYAVALGLSSAWAKFMKKSKGPTPAWFHALSHGDPGTAFSVFIATGGAGAHGGMSRERFFVYIFVGYIIYSACSAAVVPSVSRGR